MTAALEALLGTPDLARLGASLRQRPGHAIAPEPHQRLAAIAVLFRASAAGTPEFLLIKRAEHEGDPWSGHVACPGGRHEPGDASLEDTAVRETVEETGIDIRAAGRVLGTLDDLAPRTPVLPPIVIRPYVAIVAGEQAVVPSAEVASAFWVPLAQLRSPSSWGQGIVPIRNVGEREVEVFRHEGHTVWGLTHRVLSEVAERLAEG